MQDPLILRDADADEAAAVSALLESAYAEHRGRFPAPVWQSYARELTAVGDRWGAGELIVAVRSGQLVGTVTFYAEASRDGHDWPAGMASLRLLAVHPDARGTGVGRALVEECLARARRSGCARLGLHTAGFMTAANHLYAGLGFVRAPEYDFDAEIHYAHADRGPASDHLAGEAFLLPVAAQKRAG